MAKIKYIGKKPRKVDTIAGTGIVWYGAGDVQEVPDKAVKPLLAHTDSFVLADGIKQKPAAVQQVDTETKASDEQAQTDEPEKAPLVNLDGMSDVQLREYAQRYFGHTFHHKMGAEKMRQAIIGLMNRG